MEYKEGVRLLHRTYVRSSSSSVWHFNESWFWPAMTLSSIHDLPADAIILLTLQTLFLFIMPYCQNIHTRLTYGGNESDIDIRYYYFLKTGTFKSPNPILIFFLQIFPRN